MGVTAVGLLHLIPQVRAPLMVPLAMCTTGLGVLIPIYRDSDQLRTAFGRFVLASGTIGEIGPIIAMSLLLSETLQHLAGGRISAGIYFHCRHRDRHRRSGPSTEDTGTAQPAHAQEHPAASTVLFLIVRGTPVLLYRGHIGTAQRLPLALSSAVPSLSIVVVITEIGVRAKSMNPDVAAAMIGAALLSVLLFSTVAGSIVSRTTVPLPSRNPA